ncbi:hypothetical protein L6164_031102 [Bauhinia variegata]|uniref:Uncharacterized protein n=1 Tax=Bauhinia variegata TaxID=167791 RepID=A0ACB9LEK9_BAUVA|nr:hypothetical protein L6164_031102 [Bauhinia variegata]
MDLEVVGRHALLFDDDANAAFVYSSKALVEWNSLLIDRYDVRHLLPGHLPPRLKRRPVHQLDAAAASLEADLDYERFLDLLSSPSDEHEQDKEQGGYNAVAFSYGNPEESAKIEDHDSRSGFHPDFPVPESLCQNLMLGAEMEFFYSRLPLTGTLCPFDIMTKGRAEFCFLVFMFFQVYLRFYCVYLPPNEKVHQIIARTALFVSKNGGQSEIILRVKQGDNPTFGFLMPDHHLYPYFRFLVDHQEILKPGVDKNRSQDTDQTGGALSLLGSAYGYGEDDDGATENTTESRKNESEETVEAFTTASQGLGQAESSLDATKKDGGISKDPISPLKEKGPVIKRNHSISSVKNTSTGRAKKSGSVNSLSNVADKSQTSLSSTSKIELPILVPTSEMKRVIEKIVEFIVKNGREFETVLAEQDRAHGRFPFLLSSNLYHPYYLKGLQNAQESKLHGKGFLLEKHDSLGRLGDKKSAVHKEKDNRSFGSVGSDIPYDTDRKEKFKMVIGKSKKDGQEPTSKDNQPQAGVIVDAAAAVAILQAATRGIRNPSLEIFAKTSSGNGEGPSSDGDRLASLSLHSSQPQQSTEASVSVPVAKIIAQTAAIAAAGEADSSEASMTREQKLKAERLKRAKMFAAMIKGGAAPLKSEPLRGLSVEPPGSGVSGSGAETGNLAGKEREGSSVPFGADNSDKSQKSELKPSFNDEWRSKRRYRSRSRRHEEELEEEGEDKSDHKHPRKKHRSHRSRSKRQEEKEEEEKGEDRRDHKHSRKKHRSHRSSHSSPERHKHKKRHSSSKDEDSTKRKRHDSSSDDEHQQSRHRYEYDSSSDEKHFSSRHRHRESSLSDDEPRHSRRRHKHYSSSDDEHGRQRSSTKHKSSSYAERETDLEGEKSDQSKASRGVGASREASVELSKSSDNVRAPSQPSETTLVSDELRAKIRAMLMATL